MIPPVKVDVSGGTKAGAVLMRIKPEGSKATILAPRTNRTKDPFNNAALVGDRLYGFDKVTL